MAQIQESSVAGKTKRKIHPSLNIDMTPLVDLGFLLITFFMFTTTMAEKRTTNLIMPKDGDSTKLAESKALTAILGGNNKVFVYVGKWEDAVNNQKIIQSNYNLYEGLGNLIRAKQKQLGQKRDGLVLLIKPRSTASYRNVIDALDEALINNVQRYAVVEASSDEKQYVKNLQ
jgi:biopolymer transport protein ExbD